MEHALTRDKLVDAMMAAVRTGGYAASGIDRICAAAGVSKGAFFHHFPNKEALASATADRFGEMAEGLFASAPYRSLPDPRDRVLGYLDLREAMLDGPVPDVTCYLGTLVQEIHDSHPALRDAVRRNLDIHLDGLVADLAAARPEGATWSPREVATYMQATLQGAFLFAKAHGDPAVARPLVRLLRAHVSTLLNPETP